MAAASQQKDLLIEVSTLGVHQNLLPKAFDMLNQINVIY